MNLKFVVWGAGRRGRTICEILSQDSIVAYIDNDLNKIGNYINEVPIISFEKYLDLYKRYIIIISPALPNIINEIVALLKQHNISHFFVADDESNIINSNIVQLSTFRMTIQEMIYEIYGLKTDKSYVLYGLTLTSLLIYQYFKNNNITSILVCDEKNEKNTSVAQKCDIELITLGDIKIDQYDEMVVFNSNYHNIKNDFSNMIEISNGMSWLGKLKKRYNPDVIKFKNKHKGKRCFIVATAPSLTMEDLDTLEKNKELCISMNRIYWSADKTNWRPDYYVVDDIQGMIASEKSMRSYDAGVKFMAYPDYMDEHFNEDNIYKLYAEAYSTEFSDDISYGVYLYATVIYSCIQIAVYLGFSEIYFLGVDATSLESHFIEGYNEEDIIDEQTKISNLSEVELQYYKSDEKRVPDIMEMYNAALKHTNARGVKIYNATRGGALEIFPRVNFNDLF